MKLVKLFMALALTGNGVALAREHAACNNLDYRYESHNSLELRTITASCKSKAIARPAFLTRITEAGAGFVFVSAALKRKA